MIHVPTTLLDEFEAALEGTAVLGTWDPVDRVGAVTAIGLGPDAMHTHAIIGRVGESRPDEALSFRHVSGGVRAFDASGRELPVSGYKPDGFFRRMPFDPDVRDALGGQRVLVVGLGSMGAPLALGLARAGVGHIVGADPDRLEVHNCMRHVLGTDFIGWNKARALAAHFRVAAPRIRFEAASNDLFSGDRTGLARLLEELRPHAIVAATDSRNVQILTQMAAIHCGARFFALGAFHHAVEGELFIRLPEPPLGGEDPIGHACYEELHPATGGEHAATAYDYSAEVPGRYAGEPALASLIQHKVELGVTILVHVLLYGRGVEVHSAERSFGHLSHGAQYVRIGGPYIPSHEEAGGVRAVEIERPWEVRWTRLRRHRDCPLCGDDANVTGMLFPSAREAEELADWG